MRLGLIGAGKIGQLRARTLREHRSVELVAVFDLNAELARKAAQGSGARVARSLDELFDAPLDAVVISTPVHVHEEACLRAFERGLHVLLEKPSANTAAGARRLVDAALRARRAFGVGFNLRYYPAFRAVREALSEGRLGTLDHLRVYGGHEGLPKFAHEWEYKAPISGGGAMWDVGIHMSDLARHYMGEVTEVYGVASEKVWKVAGSEDNALALLRSPQGVAASYHATWSEWKGYGIFVEAYGDKGMARAAYAPMENLFIVQERPGAPRTTTKRRYPWIQVREKLFSWQTTALQSFREELDDFLLLCEGRRDLVIADGFAGLRACEVAEAVRECTRTGERVQLPALGQMPA